MRKCVFLTVCWLAATGVAAGQEIPCVAGFAGPYPCSNVTLLGTVPSGEIVGGSGNPSSGSDMWGWTDPVTGREYAVQSLSDAVAFIDVTTPTAPVFVGHLPAPATNLLWRDLKVFNDHVYIVGDFSGTGVHGLQIFDLTRLRDAGSLQVFTEDAVYSGFDEAHNIAINEATGLAYVVAADTCGGEFHILDLNQDPLNPVFLGCFDSGLPGAVHDAQCVLYHGPDTEHRDKEICLAFMEQQFSIVDMSDKSGPAGGDLIGPRVLATRDYDGRSYVHQGWFDPTHSFVASNDETDELDAFTGGTPHNTHTYFWDTRDLDDPIHIGTYVGPTGAIDHNHYFNGPFLHQFNYTAGYRVLDTTDIANASATEIAFFDTFPPNADPVPVFAGLWSGYVFASGVVAASQIDGGELFILRPDLPESEFTPLTPVVLEVDRTAVSSDGNGVFDPGETVEVAPGWRNDGLPAQSRQGTAADFDGPEGAAYTLVSASADYGNVASGTVASCRDTETCYQMKVSAPASRPARHWDARFDETLSDGSGKAWTLHIGASFADVARDSSFYPFVETILHHGVTTGCTESDYCSASANTRGQMAVFLLKAAEGPEFQPPSCTPDAEAFDDVSAGHPFCPWIEELNRRGITSGCGGGEYCPGDAVTRAQMSIFLLKALQGPGYTPPTCSDTFADVPCPSLFADWIEDLSDRGITTGCSADPLAYCPAQSVTRGQMAVFLTKTFGLTLYGP